MWFRPDSIIGSMALFDNVVKKVIGQYPQLSVEVAVHDHRKWVIIQGGTRIELNSQTPVHNPRLIICCDVYSSVTFKFEVLFLPHVCGHLPEDSDRFYAVLQTIVPRSGYYLCQGLPSEVASLMTYDTKTARRLGLPFG